MPKIDIAKIAPRLGSSYPQSFKAPIVGREKYPLGDAVGLIQFGVNLTRLKPGAASSQRHWHENEDELIFVLEGEIVLIEDEGEILLRPGDAAGFRDSCTPVGWDAGRQGHPLRIALKINKQRVLGSPAKIDAERYARRYDQGPGSLVRHDR